MYKATVFKAKDRCIPASATNHITILIDRDLHIRYHFTDKDLRIGFLKLLNGWHPRFDARIIFYHRFQVLQSKHISILPALRHGRPGAYVKEQLTQK